MADAGGAELAPRDGLEVAGDEREPVALRLAGERRERVGDAGRDEVRKVRRAQLVVGGDDGARDVLGVRVDRGVVDAGGAQQVARDRGVRAAGDLDLEPVELDAVRRPGGAPQRGGVRARGTEQQRAVDVPEQEERAQAQRRNERSELSFCANATISFAAFSTSSSWTISTGECM